MQFVDPFFGNCLSLYLSDSHYMYHIKRHFMEDVMPLEVYHETSHCRALPIQMLDADCLSANISSSRSLSISIKALGNVPINDMSIRGPDY